jgi:IS605 OrfB family transposase
MRLSYGAKIIFRNGKIYLHLSVPTWIYIEYFRKGHALGNNIASFDLNSDRINMVIVDRQGIIKDTKTEWYPEVNRPGYPRNKAWPLRLDALGRLLRYAYYHRVGTVLFEDLDRIKRKTKKINSKNGKNNRNGNRKMNSFPKKKLLEHGVLMALKYGFKVYLVSPRYTSKLAENIRDWFGLDIHTISAYTLALKYLNKETFKKLLNKDFQRRLLTK